MLIIKEVEYAVMILDELYHESPLSAAALSTRRNIPSPFIYRVLKKLEDLRIREYFYRDRMSEIRLRVCSQQRF